MVAEFKQRRELENLQKEEQKELSEPKSNDFQNLEPEHVMETSPWERSRL